jgi:hypothetical protein
MFSNRPTITSFEGPWEGQTIAQVEMPVHNPWSAAEIKAALKQDCIEFGDRTGQFWKRVPNVEENGQDSRVHGTHGRHVLLSSAWAGVRYSGLLYTEQDLRNRMK